MNLLRWFDIVFLVMGPERPETSLTVQLLVHHAMISHRNHHQLATAPFFFQKAGISSTIYMVFELMLTCCAARRHCHSPSFLEWSAELQRQVSHACEVCGNYIILVPCPLPIDTSTNKLKSSSPYEKRPKYYTVLLLYTTALMNCGSPSKVCFVLSTSESGSRCWLRSPQTNFSRSIL